MFCNRQRQDAVATLFLPAINIKKDELCQLTQPFHYATFAPRYLVMKPIALVVKGCYA